MKTRHLGKALVALAAMLAVVGLGGLPASANDAEITGGTLDLYGADMQLLDSQDLSSTANECPGSTNSTTVTHTATTHEWTIEIRSHVLRNVGGTQFTVVSEVDSNGTSSTTGTSTGSSTATVDLHPTTGTECSTAATPCIIDATAIVVDATHNVGSTSLTTSNTITATGDNGEPGDFGFEVEVAGTTCGALIGADDGAVVLTDVTVHITT